APGAPAGAPRHHRPLAGPWPRPGRLRRGRADGHRLRAQPVRPARPRDPAAHHPGRPRQEGRTMSPSSFPDPRAPLSGNDAPPRGVAVVGCGYWGVNYVRILNELPQARLVAVCDPRRDRLEEVGQRCPAALLTQDLEEALRRSDVEAVVIATGATTHHDLTTRCLQAGKHVLVEKPLATDSGQAHE